MTDSIADDIATEMARFRSRARIREASSDDHHYGAWAGGAKSAGGRPSAGGGGGGSAGAPALQERVTKGQTAAEISGKVPLGTDGKPAPIQKRVNYHVTDAKNVDSILANGFDISRANPRWTNDYGISTSPTSLQKGREYFMKRAQTTTGAYKPIGVMTGDKVALAVGVRGRFMTPDDARRFQLDHPGLRGKAYSDAAVKAGWDGAFKGNFIYNTKAIVSIRPVGPEAVAKGYRG